MNVFKLFEERKYYGICPGDEESLRGRWRKSDVNDVGSCITLSCLIQYTVLKFTSIKGEMWLNEETDKMKVAMTKVEVIRAWHTILLDDVTGHLKAYVCIIYCPHPSFLFLTFDMSPYYWNIKYSIYIVCLCIGIEKNNTNYIGMDIKNILTSVWIMCMDCLVHKRA